jgi:hypothetical protein
MAVSFQISDIDGSDLLVGTRGYRFDAGQCKRSSRANAIKRFPRVRRTGIIDADCRIGQARFARLRFVKRQNAKKDGQWLYLNDGFGADGP